MIKLKINMVTTQQYYNDSLMYKIKLKLLTKILARIKKCLTLVTFQLSKYQIKILS